MRNLIFHNRQWPFLLTILLLLTSENLSLAEIRPAFIRTELQQNEKIWPGQRQILYVKLYTTTSFAGSTRFELPEVSGMLLMESEDRPLLGTEKINGTSYIYKQHEIALFPQRAGRLTVPSFSVEFSIRAPETQVVEQNFSTGELKFSVRKIPGADPDRPVITTANLRVDDHWQPVPGKATVGDAFTRIITMTADDLPGMALPPLIFPKIEGLAQYTRQPQVADQMQRGAFTGKRIETLSYVCERQGTFTVAGAALQWWNPKSESLQIILLKAVDLTVAANPLLEKEDSADAIAPEDSWFHWQWLAIIFLFIGLAGAVFFRRRCKMKQNPQGNKENELFKEFKRATEVHSAAATMQALLHWLDCSNLSGSSATLAHFIELADDVELGYQIKQLETSMYAAEQQQQWSGDKLYTAVQRARKKLKKDKSSPLQHTLPKLNP